MQNFILRSFTHGAPYQLSSAAFKFSTSIIRFLRDCLLGHLKEDQTTSTRRSLRSARLPAFQQKSFFNNRIQLKQKKESFGNEERCNSIHCFLLNILLRFIGPTSYYLLACLSDWRHVWVDESAKMWRNRFGTPAAQFDIETLGQSQKS